MLQEMRKQSIQKTTVPAVVLILLGAILLFFSAPDITKMTGNAVNLYDLTDDEIKDQYIDCDIPWVYGSFAERYSTGSDGQRKTESQYYVIPVGEESYMAIKVPADRIAEMDVQTERTYDLLDGKISELDTAYHVRGMINRLEDEEEALLVEFFEEAGFSSSEIRHYVLPYVLEEGEGSMGGSFTSWVLFLGGIVLILYGLFILIWACTGGYQKNIRKCLASRGAYAAEAAEADYASAPCFGPIRAGKQYIFCSLGKKQDIIPVDQLLWAYQQQTTHRTYGIKTGTTYAILLYAADRKKPVSVSVSKDAAAEILPCFRNKYPHAVIGFSNELRQMFRKDRASFLNLAYYPAKEASAQFPEKSEDDGSDFSIRSVSEDSFEK